MLDPVQPLEYETGLFLVISNFFHCIFESSAISVKHQRCKNGLDLQRVRMVTLQQMSRCLTLNCKVVVFNKEVANGLHTDKLV